MKISFCILTSGQSHELKTVGAKQLVLLCPAKSYTSSNGKGTDRGVLSQGCKILLQSQSLNAHWLRHAETAGYFMHLAVKTGEKTKDWLCKSQPALCKTSFS